MSGYERKGPKLVCVRAQCWAGAGTGTNETENSGEKVVAAAGRAAAGTGGGGTGPQPGCSPELGCCTNTALIRLHLASISH